MAIINYANKEVQFKIVYYGPALCGKTTNLAYIHSQVAETNKGELVSLATAADRTLFFDFLPLNAIVIRGFKTKFQLYTFPGQVIYNATRQLVLRSVDAVVFVADSQWDKMEENIESFRNLEENLARQGLSLDTIPYALQYNKRDMPNPSPVHYLDFLLNDRATRAPSFEATATTGEGVFDTLNTVSRLLLVKFAREAEAAAATKPRPVTPAANSLAGVAAGLRQPQPAR